MNYQLSTKSHFVKNKQLKIFRLLARFSHGGPDLSNPDEIIEKCRYYGKNAEGRILNLLYKKGFDF